MRTYLQRIKGYIFASFSLDVRGLAVFRILLGCLVLADLLMNLSTLPWLFWAHSVLPPDVALRDFFEQNYRWIHVLSGDIGWQYFLFALHGIFAISLIVWWKTRISIVGTWILCCSLQGANPLIINSWDVLLRLLLFRGIFLPLGDVFSIDASRRWDTEDSWKQDTAWKTTTVLWIATVGLILQVFSVYVFSYILKTDPIWTHDFSATYYALSIDMFVTPIGQRVYVHQDLMKYITAYILYLEGFGVLLYFVPWKQQFFKALTCLLFMSFHFGLFITMYIGLFPRIGIVAWIPLLPPAVWDTLEKVMSKIRKPYTPLYTHLSPSLRFLKPGYRGGAFLVAIILYSAAWNIRAIDFDKYEPYFPYQVNKFWFLLRIDQYRAMFAPYPMRDDGRYVISWKRWDGSQINLLSPHLPVSYSKPSHMDIVNMFEHEKRRKLLNNLWFKKNASYRDYYLKYMCEKWNAEHTWRDRISSITMTYMMEMSEPDYKTDAPQKIDLYEGYSCQ